jgi:hypothetical protein
LFHNSTVFDSCIIHILYTGCAKIKKKNNSGAKRLIKTWLLSKLIQKFGSESVARKACLAGHPCYTEPDGRLNNKQRIEKDVDAIVAYLKASFA